MHHRFKYRAGQPMIVSFPESAEHGHYTDSIYIIKKMIEQNSKTLTILHTEDGWRHPAYRMSDTFIYPESCLIPKSIQFK